MKKLTPTSAAAILNVAMSINAFPEGAMPESDDKKVAEAEHIVALAAQQMVMVLGDGTPNNPGIGEQNVPAANLKALKEVLALAGVAAGTPEPAAAASDVQPVATEPTPDPVPMASDTPVAATVADEAASAGEIWLDANQNKWEIIRGGGGPQVEAKSIATGETTVIPAGFLKQRVGIVEPAQPWEDPAGPESPVGQTLEIGEQRICPANNETYILQTINEGAVVVTHAKGGEFPVNGADWMTWPLVEQEPAPQPGMTDEALADVVVEQQASAQEELEASRQRAAVAVQEAQSQVDPGEIPTGQNPDPDAQSDVVEETPVEDPTPDEKANAEDLTAPIKNRADEQQLEVPLDDDEGDEKYGNLLAQVTADYSPAGMPAPMDLERPPAAMPDDLTAIDDITARALHSQFNALASRARYLHGLESAKGRACARVRDQYMREAVRTLRPNHPKDTTLTELRDVATLEDADVQTWSERAKRHDERAEAYKTFLTFYSEDVSVLSRDWTMRMREEQGS